ncbi:MAG TPA: Ku protein [Noviherbaspirillum sp.]|uniref:Ku protein n=1 Tax=Noviherbaspirillum sp. TaxID=1926288 RepID=UPI002D45031D|nr:Ku protein [Noviherbaspirillum sp.]HYD94873.1 Ku protein [Noviherbaspirillum sp.]
MNLPDMEPHAEHATSTHAVDILAFVEAQEIPSDYFETPYYYLAPVPGGENVYALLREALREAGKIGIAYVVIQSRQHLAALIPHGQSLVLNTLRWSTQDGLYDDDEPDDDELSPFSARRMALSAPACERYDDLFEAQAMALAEQNMKTKKSSERIIVEELEGLLEDDDLIDDDVLAAVLSRRVHQPDGNAIRRSHPACWHARGRRRS